MDRIQAAIAKARAARDERAPQAHTRAQAQPRGASAAPAAPADEDAVQVAWNAIPTRPIKPQRLVRKRIATLESATEGVEFDRLRTRILQRMKPNGWRRVAIVSPGAQNGKSTVAANIAISCSRQAHLRAMLIELDLRRPGLSPILDLPEGLDVTRVLSGQAELRDHGVRMRDNLIIAPALPMRSGAAEFLQSPSTISALNEMMRTYDPSIALFDMPPMGAGDDVIGFLSNVDCALIIAAAGVTTMKEIDQCEREVAERTDVLGVVLNKCRYEGKTSEYGYY